MKLFFGEVGFVIEGWLILLCWLVFVLVEFLIVEWNILFVIKNKFRCEICNGRGFFL